MEITLGPCKKKGCSVTDYILPQFTTTEEFIKYVDEQERKMNDLSELEEIIEVK